MAAKDRQRRQNGGRTRKPGRLYRPWRRWHHGDRQPSEDRAWREASERLDRRGEGAA